MWTFALALAKRLPHAVVCGGDMSDKINGVSRQHFFDIKKAYDEHGIEGLKERSRRKPCIKNRVAPEVEEAVVNMAYEYPAYGQARASESHPDEIETEHSGYLISQNTFYVGYLK